MPEPRRLALGRIVAWQQFSVIFPKYIVITKKLTHGFRFLLTIPLPTTIILPYLKPLLLRCRFLVISILVTTCNVKPEKHTTWQYVSVEISMVGSFHRS